MNLSGDWLWFFNFAFLAANIYAAWHHWGVVKERRAYFEMANHVTENVKEQAYNLLKFAKEVAAKNADEFAVCKDCGKITQGPCRTCLVLSNPLQGENTNGPIHPGSERGDLDSRSNHGSHQPV